MKLDYLRLRVPRFFKFCCVGGVGFIVDGLIFVLVFAVTDAPIWARLVAFWCAAFATWLGNRLYTFNGATKRSSTNRSCTQQLAKHMASAHFTGAFNLAAFTLLIEIIPVYFAFVIATSIGIVSNYFLSKRFVFK